MRVLCRAPGLEVDTLTLSLVSAGRGYNLLDLRC